MTPQARQALEYVHNAGGNATHESLIVDFEPIGQKLWIELRYPDTLVCHDPSEGRARYIVLTKKGREVLSHP